MKIEFISLVEVDWVRLNTGFFNISSIIKKKVVKMPKSKEISEDIRKLVVKFKNEGKSLQKIGNILNLKNLQCKQ